MNLTPILNWLFSEEKTVIGSINTHRTKVCGQKESRLWTKREVEQRMEGIVKVHTLQGKVATEIWKATFTFDFARVS